MIDKEYKKVYRSTTIVLKITFCILFFSVCVLAQEHGAAPKSPAVPVELFLGNNNVNVQLVVSKHFNEKSKWGYFNVTNFAGDYKNDLKKNEFFTQSLLNYELFKGFSLTAGFNLNQKTGFRKVAGLQYVLANKKWLFISVPTVDLSDNHNLETFNLLEFKPKLTDKVGLYTRCQGLYILYPKENSHQRSYINLRAGLSIKNYQFGIGADSNWYGPQKANTDNVGIFARIQLN
jgi:hypothetical protein